MPPDSLHFGTSAFFSQPRGSHCYGLRFTHLSALKCYRTEPCPLPTHTHKIARFPSGTISATAHKQCNS